MTNERKEDAFKNTLTPEELTLAVKRAGLEHASPDHTRRITCAGDCVARDGAVVIDLLEGSCRRRHAAVWLD